MAVKIMQITYALDFGGAEKLAVDLATKVDRSAFSTSICALDYGGRFIPILEEMKVPWYFFNRKGALDYQLWKSLYHLFRSEHVDIIQTHHVVQLFNAILPALLNKVKIVHTEHEYQSFLNNKLDLLILRVLAPFCNAFVTVGDNVTDFFQNKRIGSRPGIITIPNGVETYFNPAIEAEALRHGFGFDSDALVVGIVARLEWRKDHRTLLHAFSSVSRQIPNVRLLIVGDGYMREELSQLCMTLQIESTVHFAGARGDVTRILHAIDVFALSSLHEGLPIALLEAMAAGRPVVCTSVGDIPRVIVHNETGLLVAPGDADALATSLLNLFRSEDERSRLGQNARRMIIEHFNSVAMIRSYEQLYQSVIRA